ncbi:CHAP domain-containing protein [Sphingomonas morindae]|uniref:CHAP domain-containing protein n=1 Tax=Sphingomonas morindae TaxID=1541170 RepID=A0ABY4X4L3_9SPHN|nr:CHAP domain-containing protein [Sphingomonas morindae]USI71791.1 CHAP domain-containing protein [Sphingomonas morindae]
MIRRLALGLALACAPLAAQAPDTLDGRIGTGLECVPFAREMSGLDLHGDAWTWWSQAAGRYAQGGAPRVGAVLVFKPHGPMRLGHVAVVSRIVSPSILMITHANWSRIGGVRGQVERDVTLVDVSDAHDWSAVRVWWRDRQGLGTTAYPVYGFIYGAHPSPKLATPSPDIVGAVIDSLGA